MNKVVTSLVTAYDVSLVTLTDISNESQSIANVFKGIAQNGINVDMISKTAPYKNAASLSFTLSDDDFPKALTFFSKVKKDYPGLVTEVQSGSTKITVSGEGMRTVPGVAARIFEIIAAAGGEIVLITTAETEVSVLVDQKDTDKIIDALKKEYNL